MVTLAQCEEMRHSLHTDSPLRLSSYISCVIQPQWFAAFTCNHQCIYMYTSILVWEKKNTVTPNKWQVNACVYVREPEFLRGICCTFEQFNEQSGKLLLVLHYMIGDIYIYKTYVSFVHKFVGFKTLLLTVRETVLRWIVFHLASISPFPWRKHWLWTLTAESPSIWI